MNLRALPVKEAFSLLDQYHAEKEKQCEAHNETTKDLTKRIETNEKQLIMIKYGSYALIINSLITAGSIIFQLLKTAK